MDQLRRPAPGGLVFPDLRLVADRLLLQGAALRGAWRFSAQGFVIMRMGDRALTELAGRRAIAQVARAKVVEIEMLLRNARLQWRARQQLLIYKVREDALVARTVGTWAFKAGEWPATNPNPGWRRDDRF